MILTSTIGSVVIAAASGSFVLSFLESEWASPINTLLLVILAFMARSNGKKIEDTGDKVDHAANAAAHAASAAADAARVAKDIGGTFRTTNLPNGESD